MYPVTFKLQDTYLSSNYILSLYDMKKTTDVKVNKLYSNIGVVSKKIIIDDYVIDTGLEFVLNITKEKELNDPVPELPLEQLLPIEVEDLQSIEAEPKEEEVPLEEEIAEDKTTVVTHMTNKTYISQLQADLAEEREARQHLEKEIQEIKQIATEIQSKIN